MARHITFSYSENLPQRILNQLPIELKISGVEDPYILLVIRLLSGTARVTHNYSNKKIDSKLNYFSGDLATFKNQINDFPNLFPREVTPEDLSIFINGTKHSNKDFYSGILSELSHFVLQTKKGSHTSAFIFIYRVLERISYAFPLIYSSKSKDFLNSFTQLQHLMGDRSRKGELGFFKSFIKTIYEGEPLAETTIDIHLDISEFNVQRQIFKQLEEIDEKSISREYTSEFDKVSINFCDMGSFIVNVRNRFFHNLSGGPSNIKSDRIVDSDLFFSFINPKAMYWLATIFLEVTSYSMSNFQPNIQIQSASAL